MKMKGCLKMRLKLKKTYKIVDIVETILEFNRQNQERQGLKIQTPNEMLNRSVKLKNEIRQLLYSLYRSKNTSKRYL